MSGWLSQIGGSAAQVFPPTILTDVNLNRYTVLPTDDTIISNSPANLILILPDPSQSLGRVLTITAATLAQISSDSPNVFNLGTVVAPQGGIIPADNQGKWVVMQAGDAGWYIVASGG